MSNNTTSTSSEKISAAFIQPKSQNDKENNMTTNSKLVSSLALGIATAVLQDERPEEGGFDLSAGMFGQAMSDFIRSIADKILKLEADNEALTQQVADCIPKVADAPEMGVPATELTPYSVIGVWEDSGQICCHHVMATSGADAFVEAAKLEEGLGMVAALRGHLMEVVDVTYPGKFVLDGEAILAEDSTNVYKLVANASSTNVSDWESMDGPSTGVGAEYWLYNVPAKLEAYVCIDQGDVLVLDVHPTV